MKQEREFFALTITNKGAEQLRRGHVWVYETEILTKERPKNGSVCDAFDPRGRYLGSGLYSEKSKIALRILTTNANDKCDEAFFSRRIAYALAYRKQVMGEYFSSSCRLIFGEADGLPGLTVDRFGDLLVTEVLSFGMEERKEMIYRQLFEILEEMGAPARAIYERNEDPIREKEGLSRYKGFYHGLGNPPESPVTKMCENGVHYLVDVENGQKTGFFLDQKFNRLAVANYTKGRRVLDCFSHTGSFGLNAALGGAEHVTCADISQTAMDMAAANAKNNGLSHKMDFICEDAFTLLPRLLQEKKNEYDFIILDPPAFTKSAATGNAAYGGYLEINRRAMQLLPRGGYLATCSCSHFMPAWRFEDMLKDAAAQAKVSLRQIEQRQQACDHPILWNVPETSYLKFYLFQVV